MDLSLKKQGKNKSIRFNIRCPHNSFQNKNIEKCIKELGFDFSWKYISNIISSMNDYSNSKYDSLYIVGFSIENDRITSIKYYFTKFENQEIITDYNNFEKYHSKDKEYFLKITDILNIQKNIEIELKTIFDYMNKNKAYIAFIGVDFNLEGKSIYKIYFKINDECISVSELSNFFKLSDEVKSEINKCSKNDKKIDFIAIAFSESSILQYQLYLSERT